MPEFTKRSLILGAAGTAAAGAGVAVAIEGLQGSVEEQAGTDMQTDKTTSRINSKEQNSEPQANADVQAEQALTVTDVSVVGDQDAKFIRRSDDNMNFQVAVNLNYANGVAFVIQLENSAADPLDIEFMMNAPDPIDINVGSVSRFRSFLRREADLDFNDNNNSNPAIQTGKGTFITRISGTESDTLVANIVVLIELDDTADPGSYDIGASVNPLSAESASGGSSTTPAETSDIS